MQQVHSVSVLRSNNYNNNRCEDKSYTMHHLVAQISFFSIYAHLHCNVVAVAFLFGVNDNNSVAGEIEDSNTRPLAVTYSNTHDHMHKNIYTYKRYIYTCSSYGLHIYYLVSYSSFTLGTKCFHLSAPFSHNEFDPIVYIALLVQQ